MRNKGKVIKKALVFITLASVIMAGILAVSRTITEYVECW